MGFWNCKSDLACFMNLDDTYGKWDSTFKELIEVESPLKKKLTISPSYVESDCAFSSYMASSTCLLGIAVSAPFSYSIK